MIDWFLLMKVKFYLHNDGLVPVDEGVPKPFTCLKRNKYNGRAGTVYTTHK